MDAATEDYQLKFKQFDFRIELFFDGYLGPKERDALTQWKKNLSSIDDHSRRVLADAKTLVSDLNKLVDQL